VLIENGLRRGRLGGQLQLHGHRLHGAWIEIGLNASHMVGPHNVLFEGNYGFNAGSGYTWPWVDPGERRNYTYCRPWRATTPGRHSRSPEPLRVGWLAPQALASTGALAALPARQ
jgi:hypothetical protein